MTLERERVSGGDGFLTAAQTAARARGEVVETGGKKKKGPKDGPSKRGFNLKGRAAKGVGGGSVSGVATPMTEDMESGQTTPMVDDDEGEDEDGDGQVGQVNGMSSKEIITCESM